MIRTIGYGSTFDYNCQGATDIAFIINAAISEVDLAGGGSVEFEYRVFGIKNPIIYPEDARVTLQGAKMPKAYNDGTIISALLEMESMIEVSGKPNPQSNADLNHNNSFKDLALFGNLKATNGILFTNQDYAEIERVRVIGATNGISTKWNSTQAPTMYTIPGGLRINDCILSAEGGHAVNLEYQTQCWITNPWFSKGANLAQSWVRLKSCNKIRIHGAEFNTVQSAILLEDDGTVQCHTLSIDGNTFAVGQGNSQITDIRSNKTKVIEATSSIIA